jgi:hypothetical protein
MKERAPSAARGRLAGLLEKEGRRERSEQWRDATLIPRESGGGPVRASVIARVARGQQEGLQYSRGNSVTQTTVL